MDPKFLQLLSTPAVPLALLLTLLLGLAIYLFLAMKIELRLLSRRSVTRAELESTVRQWASEMAELRVRVNEAEGARFDPAAQPDALPVSQLVREIGELRARLNEIEQEGRRPLGLSGEPESLNLNRRAQILGLHRKGKPAREIASTLRIPQGEVELMVKVHHLSQSSREINQVTPL
jgi:hypothetical protein